MTEVSLSIIQSRASRMSAPEAWLSEFLENATVGGGTVYYEADSEWHRKFRTKYKPRPTPQTGVVKLPEGLTGTAADPAIWGPPLWEAFHETTLKVASGELTLSDGRAWLQRWATSIPGGCGCRNDALTLLAANPTPDDGSQWPRWGWEIHNLIRGKLGQELFTWEAFVAARAALPPPS